LFEPRLQDYRPRSKEISEMPVSENAQAWTALLGGALPATAVAFVNSRRLGVPQWRQVVIVLVGLLAFLISLGIHYAGAVGNLPSTIGGSGWGLILADRLVALLACLVFYRCQNPEYRCHLRFGGMYQVVGSVILRALLILGPVQWYLTNPMVAGLTAG
jgi:hypothetical protein